MMEREIITVIKTDDSGRFCSNCKFLLRDGCFKICFNSDESDNRLSWEGLEDGGERVARSKQCIDAEKK